MLSHFPLAFASLLLGCQNTTSLCGSWVGLEGLKLCARLLLSQQSAHIATLACTRGEAENRSPFCAVPLSASSWCFCHPLHRGSFSRTGVVQMTPPCRCHHAVIHAPHLFAPHLPPSHGRSLPFPSKQNGNIMFSTLAPVAHVSLHACPCPPF
jgi:hypothetical protein